MHEEYKAHRAREQWGRRAWVVGKAATGLRAQARYLVCSTMSDKPEPKPRQPSAVRGYGGPGLVGVRAEVARMQADAAPLPPSRASSATYAEVLSPSSPESPEMVRQEGPRATGRQRGEEAAAGTGEGGDRGGQAEASGGRAEEVLAGAEGQGEGQGQWAAVGGHVQHRGCDGGRRYGEEGVEGVGGGRPRTAVGAQCAGGEDSGGGRPRTAVGAQCAGGCHEVHPPGSAEAGERQGLTRAARGGSGREQGQQCMRRREGADKQGGERAGGDIRGCASEGTPGRERG